MTNRLRRIDAPAAAAHRMNLGIARRIAGAGKFAKCLIDIMSASALTLYFY
ncbi:hypothetical protein [Paraburkholderia jirisanensis]